MDKVAQLTGSSGNIFSVIGRTNRFLKKAIREGEFTVDGLKKFNAEVGLSQSYDEALSKCISALENAGYEVT